MTTAEILKRVRQLEIRSKKLATDLFTGAYHSAFKGRGMSFKEIREYAPGDDVRFIDWNVSARFDHPFSKLFEEERELTVMLLIDVSASTLFGSTAAKRDRAAEITAALAFSAVNNGDKVGALLYTDRVERFIPPRKGKKHVLFLIRELLGIAPRSRGSDLSKALKYFSNTNRQQSISFILSDFMDQDYEDALRVAARRHDIVGVKIYDRLDQQLPNVGLLEVEDLESSRRQWVDTGNAYVRYAHEQAFLQLTAHANAVFRKAGSNLLHVRTDEDYVQVLQHFIISRARP